MEIKEKLKEIYSCNDDVLKDEEFLFKIYNDFKAGTISLDDEDKEILFYLMSCLLFEKESLFDYPEMIEYILNNSRKFPLLVFENLLNEYEYKKAKEETKEYDSIIFKINEIIGESKFNYYGLQGGMGLVNSLFTVDYTKLYLSNILIKKDPLKAYKYLRNYRRDELTQKWYILRTDCDDVSINKLIKKVFNNLINLYEKRKDEPLLIESLIYGYYFGFGANIDIKKAKDLSKELISIDPNCPDYIYDILDDKRKIKDLNTCIKNDLVELGIYDFRSITWKVLDRTDNEILLLSEKIIESKYMAIVQNELYSYEDGTPQSWLDDIFIDRFKKTIKNIKIKKCYIMSKDELFKHLNTPDKRVCVARDQALNNGYDNEGVDKAYNGNSPYIIEDKENRYIDEFGRLSYGYSLLGIRPVLKIKLK